MTNEERLRKCFSTQELAKFLCHMTECANCIGQQYCRFGGGSANGLVTWLGKDENEDGETTEISG